MTKFTNHNNFFRNCADILLKVSYSVKRALSKLRAIVAEVPKIILFVLLFLLAMLFSSLPAGSVSDHERGGWLKLTVEVRQGDDGGVIAVLLSDSPDGFCGLLAELSYDDSVLELVSTQEGEGAETLYLTFRDSGGKITILADGEENTCGGEIASFYFVKKSNLSQNEVLPSFTVSARGDGAAYTKRDGELEELKVFGCSVLYGSSGGSSFCAEINNVSEEESEICFSYVSEQSCCFAGVRVVVTELYGTDSQQYLLAGAMSSEGDFQGTIRVPTDKKYIVTASSVTWHRDGAVFGEEHIYVLQGGNILCRV